MQFENVNFLRFQILICSKHNPKRSKKLNKIAFFFFFSNSISLEINHAYKSKQQIICQIRGSTPLDKVD
jgi:hypothetical protein